MELRICHLYPDLLNLYGDGGNIRALENRLRWRGLGASVTPLPLGARDDLTGYDLLFIGGGQDFEQELLLADLAQGRGAALRSAIDDGVTVLAVCGGYQMLGESYQNQAGHRCGFLGAVDFSTVAGETRMIGNFAFRCGAESGGSVVVGFENHSGRTRLGPGVMPLGRVLSGCGNNGADGGEGVRWKNVFGTYSHGPVLPKNPALCDAVLETALTRKYGACTLAPLPDAEERAARAAALRALFPLRWRALAD
jgi:CobQ-like glutamine amidotransferase family enzyme